MSIGGGIPGGNGGSGWGRPEQLPPVSGQQWPQNRPDWETLARQHEAELKKRRMLQIGGGAAAVVVVAGIVTAAIALSGPAHPKRVDAVGPATPSASASASASGSAAPSPTPTLAQLVDKYGSNAIVLSKTVKPGQADGHNGPAVLMTGKDTDHGESNGPVVDTSKSFTVSALVDNNAPKVGRCVLSQGSGDYYTFYLGRDDWGIHNQWVFKVQTLPGGEDKNARQAFSKQPSWTGKWVLLTGVYDASAKSITLYVNGEPQDTTKVDGIWNSASRMQLGRAKYHGAWVDNWDGAISDVLVWNQALSASDVAQLQKSGGTTAGAAPMAGWLLDEG
ncbi:MULTISPECIES: LamG domain-containing protein [Kitasatospora]|uniref:LamG-like jellyroll fold domain-containing protein n=1 Tax=Kitasatospora cystarginea TaxID=58350 RepID=A0ABN3EXU1_9ACTN